MDLFDWKGERAEQAPLAERMKPRTVDEFVGQAAIMAEGKLLPSMIRNDRLGSIILHGPPGCGKTSLARIIANTTAASADFITLNAVTSGVKDIREAVDRAKENSSLYGKRTFVFIDEIHRFNKLQQDALLPYVESGQITLIGATTENPYFEVNSALISRSTIFRLTPLSDADIVSLLHRALADVDRGLGTYRIAVDEEILEEIAALASGDARRALNILEMAVNSKPALAREIRIERSDILDTRKGQYDKKGDNHYDIVSAFIKSMRGSDPDAALHYLARMIAGGEDPLFIARRIVICASED
ncbi:MAG: replication-associated recombination protein A, partial [Bacillota bacterium]|nr:replication-associated recombination protein A [Bacillota bacterium]